MEDARMPSARALCFSENHLLTIVICAFKKKGAVVAARNYPTTRGQNSLFRIEMSLMSMPRNCRMAQNLRTVASLNLSKAHIDTMVNGMEHSEKLIEHMLT